jgi:hypothetical protein
VGTPERLRSSDGESAAAPRVTAVPAVGLAAYALALQRQIGNRLTARLLSRDTVTMPPATITASDRPVESGVSGLDQLRGVGVDPNAMTIVRDPADVARNSPLAERPLPFTGPGSWDAQAILTVLGQYDTIAGTDSDAIRCVQAAALGARIVRGPASVMALLSAAGIDGMLGNATGARQRTAQAVLRYVRGRIESQRATFGDLSWAQEALHDLFYDDVSGTPLPDILRRVAPSLDLTFNAEARSTWFATPDEVIAAANALNPGEQLLLNTWQVFFNEAFEQLEDRHIHTPVGGSQVVNIGGRDVTLRRIDTSRKPSHTAIDQRRDNMHGHQLLIINDAAIGGLRLYEPEVTTSGRHLEALTAAILAPYFRDLPDIAMYTYMETLGKLTPSSFASP